MVRRNALLESLMALSIKPVVNAVLVTDGYPVFSPAQIHRKGHIEYFQRWRSQPDMKRQAFAPPGLFFEREEARDEILVVFEARPPLLLDQADGELERDAGGLEQDAHQGEVDRNRLPDEIRRRVPVEVIEQGLQGAVWIDAILRDLVQSGFAPSPSMVKTSAADASV